MDINNKTSSKIVRKTERINDYQTKQIQSEPLNGVGKPDKEIEENGIALFIKAIAWAILIIGFICGIAYSYLPKYASAREGFSWITAIVWWGPSLISFAVMLGLGEIISLLNKIYHK